MLAGSLGMSSSRTMKYSTFLLPCADQPDKKSGLVAFLSYAGFIFNRIIRVLSQHNIKSVCLSPKKISSFLQLVKNDLGLRTPGVYSIPVNANKAKLDRQAICLTSG
jgi:hypothetical protein